MIIWIQSLFDNLPAEGYRAQRYWLMAQAFRAAGHQVEYWTGDFSHASKKRRNFISPPKDFVHLIPVRPYKKNVSFARIRSHRTYAKAWERAAIEFVDNNHPRRPDIIICAMPPVATASITIRLGARFNCKTVIDIQDAWPETFYRLVPTPLRWLAKLLLRKMYREVQTAYRRATLVTGVSSRYAALCGRNDFHLAYLGIALPQSTFNPPPSTSIFPRLIYLGNLGRTYDLPTLIRAVKYLPTISLDIAGAGPCEAQWRALARDCLRIRFHGYLNRRELATLISQCSIGVIPMCSDSFVGLPNKLGDYAMHGLTIVSSLKGETEELLMRFKCGTTYIPHSVPSLLTAIATAQTLTPNASRALVETVLNANNIYPEYVQAIIKLKGDLR